MKGSDKAVVLGVLMAIVLGVFYFKVLAPKRHEASTLKKDVASLNSQVSQQQQTAQYGEQARQQFPSFYGHLVVLGKAVPARADSASLLVQLNSIASATDVEFRSIAVGAGGGTPTGTGSTVSTATTASSTTATSTTGTSTTGTSTTPAPSGSSSAGSASTPTSSAPVTPAPATESSAANIPIGAEIGSAGLAVMPYDMTFTGTYFQVADFLHGVDDLVHVRGATQVAPDGRLMTINGFELNPSQNNRAGASDPTLDVTLSVTTYAAPSDQGLTAGASPTGPGAAPTQPVSAAVTP
jgi:Tfp pilus assembly protein PilO